MCLEDDSKLIIYAPPSTVELELPFLVEPELNKNVRYAMKCLH